MYRRSRQTAWRTIADETVLLDLDRKQMYGLNPAAARVWQILETVAGLEEMHRALAAGGEPGFERAELEAFVSELLDLGLAREVAEPDAAGPEDRPALAPETPGALEPPRILWREEVEQIAGTCAFLPATSPLCTQAPFS